MDSETLTLKFGPYCATAEALYLVMGTSGKIGILHLEMCLSHFETQPSS